MTPQGKGKYSIRNWKEYNKSLVERGSITLWFSEEAIKRWYSEGKTNKKGRPEIYSDEAILCALMIRSVYKLPLRALEGFLISLMLLLGLTLKVPSYSQICRRAKSLKKRLKKLSSCRPVDIVFDSTGLKVYGEGEWKVKKHGSSKQRTWRKLHIGIDLKRGEIVVEELTDNGTGGGDSQTGERLLEQISPRVERIFGDGSYDSLSFRRKIEEIGAVGIIPPPRNAIVHETIDPALIKRNKAIQEIVGLGGDDIARKLWKKLYGYHKRSLVETMMYRIKQLTGATLKSRTWERQSVEAHIKCLVVNKMTKLGMPVGRWGKVT